LQDHVIVEVHEFLPRELGPVVGDDAVRDPEAVDDVEEELHRIVRAGLGDQLYLDPLGELVHRYEEVVIALGCFPEGSDHV
jgi:hypothetical protein